MHLSSEQINQILDVCRAHCVDTLYAFGSVLNDNFNLDSDVDLIVSIVAENPMDYTEHYFSLKFKIEDILGRKVDLLEEQSISNAGFKSAVDTQKRLLYARENKRVA